MLRCHQNIKTKKNVKFNENYQNLNIYFMHCCVKIMVIVGNLSNDYCVHVEEFKLRIKLIKLIFLIKNF